MTERLALAPGLGPREKLSLVATRIVSRIRLPFRSEMLDPFRHITAGAAEQANAGAGLITRLRELQSPVLAQRAESRATWEQINGFVRDVLQEPSAFLEVPAATDELYVSLRGKMLEMRFRQ